MKKLFLSSLCVAALMTACNSEEPVIGGGNSGELGEPQFLSVNLITTSGSATRAPEGAEYEAGLEQENKVNKVRFYFFEANGDPAAVRNNNGTLVNWLDWEDVNTEGDNMENVEKILSATLVIQSPKGDSAPAQIVALINPTEATPSEERSLSTLSRLAYNCGAFASEDNPRFVMSNSTYMANGVEMNAVSVDGKIHKTQGEALNDPVQIYVERTVAKVRLNSTLTPIEGMTNVFKTSKLDETGNEVIQKVPVFNADGSIAKDENGNEKYKEIYVQFLGWNTTAVTSVSRLVKDINVAWPTDLFGAGNGPWNWSDYFRSFWAVNPQTLSYQYGAFGDADTEGNIFKANANTAFDASQWVYINENATDYAKSATGDNPSTPTKVIIAAQLVDEKGNPVEFAEYGATRTTVEGLKVLFANNCGLYKKHVEGEGEDMITTFEKITPADLAIFTATEVGAANQSTPGRYKSYVQLKEKADNVWYNSTNKDAEPISADDANGALKALGYAKVWTNGFTYYYFDIKHLGNKIGVVRNHIYDTTVTALTGLGTPVYKPEEIIYPEKPTDDDDTFIAAQINILSWRIVKSDNTLDW